MAYKRAARAEYFVGAKHPERGRGRGPFVVREDTFDADGKVMGSRKTERPTMEQAENQARAWKAERARQGVTVGARR